MLNASAVTKQKNSLGVNDYLEQCESVNEKVVDLLQLMKALSSEHNITPPGKNFETALERVQAKEANLVFMGEIKRGKSLLINSLTGLDLPTQHDIATCQCFKIYFSQEIECRVRFIDDSTEDIESLEEAYRIGSQLAMDTISYSQFDQPIKWVEIGFPFSADVPRSLCIFDTPGVGGVNPEHERLTLGVLDECADGVILVLDSLRPIDQCEIDLLANVLSYTNQVKFVQTKIDQVSEADWKQVKDRNETVLKEKFGKQLTDTSVWPISSLLLQQAAREESNKAIKHKASRFPEFAPVFYSFAKRVAGLGRVGIAVQISDGFLKKSIDTLHSRHQAVNQENTRLIEDEKRAIGLGKRMFEDDKSAFNRLSVDTFEKLKSSERKIRYAAEDFFSELEIQLSNCLANSRSTSDAEECTAIIKAKLLIGGDELLAECSEVLQDRYAMLVAQLIESVEPAFRLNEPPDIEVEPILLNPEKDIMNRLFHAKNRVFAAGVPVGALAWLGVFSPPVAMVAGSAAVLLGFVNGWCYATKLETNSAKAKFGQQFEKQLRKARTNCLRYLDDCFRRAEAAFREQLAEYERIKKSETKKEIEFRTEQLKKNAEERKKSATRRLDEFNQWRNLQKDLAALAVSAEALWGAAAT